MMRETRRLARELTVSWGLRATVFALIGWVACFGAEVWAALRSGAHHPRPADLNRGAAGDRLVRCSGRKRRQDRERKEAAKDKRAVGDGDRWVGVGGARHIYNGPRTTIM